MLYRITCWLLLLTVVPAVSLAQTRRTPTTRSTKSSRKKTSVTVELLADNMANGLTQQQWGQAFDKIGYAVRIRQALLDEKPEVKERTLGSLRQVTVIGKLDRRGTLIFADRTFTQAQVTKLAEWLRSLEVYGAQGSPEGKPIWGLNKKQFDILYNALSVKNTSDVQGKRLADAIAAMKVPDMYPIRYTTAARDQLTKLGANPKPVRAKVQGHSKGTALALMLSEYGLGFRPQRMPNGGLELAIEANDKGVVVWPVGWDLKASRSKTAPQFFKLIPVELDEVHLVDALDGIAAVTDVPIHFDRFGIEAQDIDVDKIVVSYPSKKTSWSLLLRSITTPYKLTRKFRIDERGKPFVWVTALVPKRRSE